MTRSDLIYCYTCKQISIDNSRCKMQDSRFNPKWNYRCPYCYGFKTVNASQFLESGKSEIFKRISSGTNLPALRTYANNLKSQGLIKGYKIETRRPINVLYERRRVKKEIIRALKNREQKESFK